MPGRILIATSVATNRIILKVQLEDARYDTVRLAEDADIFDAVRTESPDMVILDAGPEVFGPHGLCRRLKSDSSTCRIPLLVLDTTDTRAARMAALRAGADEYLAKPYLAVTLLALVRKHLRARAQYENLTRRQLTAEELGFGEAGRPFARAARVSLIAPTPGDGLKWRHSLASWTRDHIQVTTRVEALDGMDPGKMPDAFVIAADLTRPGDGLALVSELRARQPSRHAVIFVVDDANQPETVPMALDIGATAVLGGAFDGEEVALRLSRLMAEKMESDALRSSLDARLSLAMVDELTGLSNRRYARTHLARIASAASDSAQPFALMLLDLDRFKSINDRHGHIVGDEVLAEVARRLHDNVRDIDLLARYGGEEFVIAMPSTDLTAARIAAERLRRVIGDTPCTAASTGVEVAVTVSIGVQVCTGAASPLPALDGLLQQADAALYVSKSEGRNLVTFASHAAA